MVFALLRRVDGKRHLRSLVDAEFDPSAPVSSANVAMRTSLKVTVVSVTVRCVLPCCLFHFILPCYVSSLLSRLVFSVFHDEISFHFHGATSGNHSPCTTHNGPSPVHPHQFFHCRFCHHSYVVLRLSTPLLPSNRDCLQ